MSSCLLKIHNDISHLLRNIGISDPLRNENFFICKIEDHFGDEALSIGPYKNNFFEIIFGRGHDVDCKIGTSAFKPLKDSISFASPYQMSSWKVNSFSEDALGYMLFFKPQLLSGALDKLDLYKKYPFFNLNMGPVIFLNQGQIQAIVSIMKNMLTEYKCYRQNQDDGVLAAYLVLLLEKIKQFYNSEASDKGFTNRAEEITCHFENLLKEKGTYSLKISDYASDLNISPVYLSEAVKNATGKAPMAIIQDYLILQAKGFLHQSNKTVSAIAHELGFDEASNFVKYFKKRTGITPGAYRKLP